MRYLYGFWRFANAYFINQKVKEKLQEEQKKEEKRDREQGRLEGKIQGRQKVFENDMKIIDLFVGFVEQKQLPKFQFAILSAKKYESNYKKLALEKIYVELGQNRVEQFANTLTVNSVLNDIGAGEKIFYVYTSRENKEHYAEKRKDIGEAWAEYVNENWRRIYEG